jgi:hypothetical protein
MEIRRSSSDSENGEGSRSPDEDPLKYVHIYINEYLYVSLYSNVYIDTYIYISIYMYIHIYLYSMDPIEARALEGLDVVSVIAENNQIIDIVAETGSPVVGATVESALTDETHQVSGSIEVIAPEIPIIMEEITEEMTWRDNDQSLSLSPNLQSQIDEIVDSSGLLQSTASVPSGPAALEEMVTSPISITTLPPSTETSDVSVVQAVPLTIPCPTGYEPEVFYSLPEFMQQEIADQHVEEALEGSDVIRELVEAAGG